MKKTHLSLYYLVGYAICFSRLYEASQSEAHGDPGLAKRVGLTRGHVPALESASPLPAGE